MENYSDGGQDEPSTDGEQLRGLVPAGVAPEPPQGWGHRQGHQRRVVVPVILFVITCASTLFSGLSFGHLPEGLAALEENENARAAQYLLASLGMGLWYAVPVMTILICHEAGHFFQARRYGVHASLPYFLPMPLSPLGTMGAFIVMEPGVGDRKALFDIGITGPLAGLVPTLIFSIVGL